MQASQFHLRFKHHFLGVLSPVPIDCCYSVCYIAAPLSRPLAGDSKPLGWVETVSILFLALKLLSVSLNRFHRTSRLLGQINDQASCTPFLQSLLLWQDCTDLWAMCWVLVHCSHSFALRRPPDCCSFHSFRQTGQKLHFSGGSDLAPNENRFV